MRQRSGENMFVQQLDRENGEKKGRKRENERGNRATAEMKTLESFFLWNKL